MNRYWSRCLWDACGQGMRTWFATPEDKQDTYSAPQTRSDDCWPQKSDAAALDLSLFPEKKIEFRKSANEDTVQCTVNITEQDNN